MLLSRIQVFTLLSEAVAILEIRELSKLEEEGVIQRFEYTWELAWKTIKDYLESQGVVLDTITPANVIKVAYASKIISNGELWMEALDTRNKMSHTYNFQLFEQAIVKIRYNYLNIFNELCILLQNK
jgi:nucleotidyltransferase substrate binding protein (TIGR01987 family)